MTGESHLPEMKKNGVPETRVSAGRRIGDRDLIVWVKPTVLVPAVPVPV